MQQVSRLRLAGARRGVKGKFGGSGLYSANLSPLLGVFWGGIDLAVAIPVFPLLLWAARWFVGGPLLFVEARGLL